MKNEKPERCYLTYLRIKDFKRISLFEATFEATPGVIEIAGKNDSGKSSLTDAFVAVLQQAQSAKGRHLGGLGLTQPVRKGQKKAEVEAIIGRFRLEGVWRAESGTKEVKVTTTDGSPMPGTAQKVLDELVGPWAFDPMRFSLLPPKDQFAVLLDLKPVRVKVPGAPGPMTLADADALRDGKFGERTDVNREVKKLRARQDALDAPDPGVPEETESVTDLVKELQQAQATQQNVAEVTAAINDCTKREDLLTEEIELLRTKLRGLKEVRESVREEGSNLAGQLVKAGKALIDPKPIQQRLATLEDRNNEVLAAREYRSLSKMVAEEELKSKILTDEIEDIDKAKETALASMKFPVPGLKVARAEDGTPQVLFEGIPLQQASQSQRLEVGFAIHVAQDTTCRLARVTEGAFLDADGRKTLDRLSRANEIQTFLELVDAYDDGAIIIEDGQRKG